MIELLGDWIRALVGAAVICAVATALTPEGKSRKITAVVCGLVMIAVLISPIKDFDAAEYCNAVAKYSLEAQQVSDDSEKVNDRLSRTIIEDKCAAYILDKAEKLGISATAEVTARWDTREHVWYPYEAVINSQQNCSELSDVIETELGIPKERQYRGEKP